MKCLNRLLSLALLLTLCITVVAGCTQSDPTPPEETTEASESLESSESKLIIDSTYCICIPADADDITRKTADMLAAAIKEKAGPELSVKEADDQSHAAHVVNLAVVKDYEAGAYTVKIQDPVLQILASDSTTLYYAVEAVLDTWLTADFGLTEAGVITLPESRVAELNRLTTRLDNSIRILTQNMRGSDDPDGNTVQLRSARFIQMVEEYQPDLIGTQEYSYNWRVWLEKHEKRMGGSAAARIYGQVGDNNNGPGTKKGGMNAILYRMDRFELLETDTFWLSHTPEIPSVIGDRRDLRICTWAKFKDLQTGEIFIFANTHLDHADLELNYLQAEILLEHLTAIAAGYPLYLSGDFNVSPYSSTYGFVAQTLQDAHKTAWTQTGENWGTYHAYMQSGSEIDFIFHDTHSTPIRYEIITKQYDGYISDHYGVVVDFVNE